MPKPGSLLSHTKNSLVCALKLSTRRFVIRLPSTSPSRPRNHPGTTETASRGTFRKHILPEKLPFQGVIARGGISRNVGDLWAMKLWIRRSVVRIHPTVPAPQAPNILQAFGPRDLSH